MRLRFNLFFFGSELTIAQFHAGCSIPLCFSFPSNEKLHILIQSFALSPPRKSTLYRVNNLNIKVCETLLCNSRRAVILGVIEKNWKISLFWQYLPKTAFNINGDEYEEQSQLVA